MSEQDCRNLESHSRAIGFRCATVRQDENGFLLCYWYGCMDYWVELGADYASSIERLDNLEVYLRVSFPAHLMLRSNDHILNTGSY